MSAHAFLPPSGASSWSKCSAWPLMNQQFPQDETAESLEGSAAHWTGWEIYAGRTPAPGAKAPNGVLVTDEMIEGGELLSDTMRAKIPNEPAIEKQIEIPLFKSFGTPDAWSAWMQDQMYRIAIVDYKFGHRFVDEWWNPQGLCYLDGILNQLRIMGNLDERVTIEFTVVQPRCFYKGNPVRSHIFTLAEARQHFNHLSNMAEAAAISPPLATTNPTCGDCPGRHACSALQLAAYSDAEYSNVRTALELPPAAAALELKLLSRALQRLEARVEGLKEYTIANIRAGKAVPYFRIEQGFGRVQWTIPDSQIIAIGQMIGQDLSKPGTITPTQAKAKGVDEKVIKAYSFTPSTSLKLISETAADAAKVFGK